MFYLKEQLEKYPLSQPRDLIKLCFQAAFGSEHLLNDKAAAHSLLTDELPSVPPEKLPLFEKITDSLCRVSLAAWKYYSLPEDWLFNMFSACGHREDKSVFDSLLKEVSAAVEEGLTSFSQTEWEEALADYFSESLHAVHHSDRYRNAYAPAYRLVPCKFLCTLPLLIKMAEKKQGVVAIDGHAAAGKSTLADLLQEVTHCSLVHTDDFFLPPSLRSNRRLSRAGGNIHYERFVKEVLDGLRCDYAFSYGRFDCSRQEITEQVFVGENSWRVVEGCYSLHPEFLNYADIRVFMTLDADTQRERLAKRSPELLDSFLTKWIPMEENYFASFGIKESCDLVLQN